MKHFSTMGKVFLRRSILAGALAVTSFWGTAYGQTPQVRTYATRQQTIQAGVDVGGSFTAPAQAVDGNPATAANLTLGVAALGAYREQVIDFNPDPAATAAYAATIAGNRPITLKITVPAGLVSALGGLEIQAITNLRRTGTGIPVIDPYVWQYTNVGTLYSNASLVGLISGAGEMEVTITPGAAYQGIRVRLNGGVLAAAVGVDVYDAYVKSDATASVLCSAPIDVLSGVRAGAIALANATGSVTGSWNAIDGGGTALSTFAQLNTGAQVLSQVYHTTIFNTTSKIGDSVRLVVQDVSGALLSLNLLAGFTVNLYNGSSLTPVQTLNNSSPLLSLRLLNPTNNISEIVAPSTAVFDRVEVSLGGVAGAFSSLRIYDVSRKAAGATLATASYNVYAGQGTTLNATSSNGDNVVWYSAATGGSTVSNVVTTTPVQAGSTLNYFVGTSRTGCAEGSERRQVNVNVIGVSTATLGDGLLNNPYSSSVAVTAQGAATLPSPPVFNYALTSGTLPNLTLSTTTGAITGTPNAAGTFPIGVGVNDVANSLPVGTFNYSLVINNVPLPVHMTSFTGAAADGSVILKWTTVNEKDNAGFGIEHSIDGKNFTGIGYQPSLAAAGNSDQKLAYEYRHTGPVAGMNYYRLKQIDKDGRATYTDIVNVLVLGGQVVNIYPNPAHDRLSVAATGIRTITLYSLSGAGIQVPVTYGATQSQVHLSGIAAGTYMLQVDTDSGSHTYKILVRH